MRLHLTLALIVLCCSLAQAYSFEALGLVWKCSVDPVVAKSYRPQTADFMWPSMSGPQLNLVFHLCTPQASAEEELEFAFGERLKPENTQAAKGWSLSRGRGFRGAFVHTSKGRIFIGLRSRSQPPMPEARLDSLVHELISSAYR